MASSHDVSHEANHEHHAHVIPFAVYRNVLIALLVLTVITVVVAKWSIFDFGAWNIALAMIIASVKATIVALYFMHLKFEDKVTWLYATFPLLLLVIMMGLIFLDNPFREDIKPGEINDPLAERLAELG